MVEGYARNHKIPMMSPKKDESQEDFVRPYLQRMQRRNQRGVYFIIPRMEMGRTFCSRMPKYPTDDPDYRIIRSRRSRHLHYYFYIRDAVLGPLAMCVSTYLPFQSTYYLNGHHFMEIELSRQGVTFRKDDNPFLSTADPKALEATSRRPAPRLLHQSKSNTAATSSSNGTAKWDCSAWPPIRWPTSSGCASPNGYVASCTARWKDYDRFAGFEA